MVSLQSCRSLLTSDVPTSSLASSGSPAFSSSPTFIAAPSLPLPRRPASTLTRCSLSEKFQDNQVRPGRRLLTGVIAAGAAIAVFSNMSMAAIGPGGDGARRTAEKADDLLKAADKLNTEEAPKRFGPGRPGALQDETKISQVAGGGSTATSSGATDPAK